MSIKKKSSSSKKITGKKQQKETCTAGSPPISEVFYNLPDATFAIDNEGTVIAWNRAMEKSTGIIAADMIGKGDHEYAIPFYGTKRPLLIDLIDETDEKIREWGYITIRRKGNALMAENPTIDPDNTVRILWGLAAPISDSSGNRIGSVQSIADVTSRWKRETVLENTVLKFQEILDNVGTATLIIEEDDTISFINPEFGRILGYVREEIEGKKKWMEFVVPEDVRSVMRFMTSESLRSEGPINIEVRFIRWDGDVRNALMTITRVPGTQKLVVAIHDITDKIRAETAVQLANRKLSFLNSIIRHDILNHLTVLKGNIDLAREINTDPKEGAVLEKEMAATEAIQALITFTREYQDIGNEPPEWQDVKQSILRSCAGIRLGEITLSVDIDGVEINADRLLSSVFQHLVQNAVRHGEKTTRIRLFCEESFEELHIVCEDDGIGVPPEAKEKIFNREFFNRTGLEMYLSQEILSITGIGIRETGVYGEGACFELRVPKGRYRFSSVQQ
jgi:PAS domain S-box-containing protein